MSAKPRDVKREGDVEKPADQLSPVERLHGLVSTWPSRTSRDWAAKFVNNWCGNPNIDAIVLIGSVLRGSTHSRSDVDLIVIRHGGKLRFERPEVDVDVRTFDRDSVDTLIEQGNDLLGWSVYFGSVICERNHYWTTLVRKWRSRVPLPSPDVAVIRARASRARALELLANGDREAATDLIVSMLTQYARAIISRAGVYPASRGELPSQLRVTGHAALAEELESALRGKWNNWESLVRRPGYLESNALITND
jgi:predicted nucleotidyltransferase